MVRTKRTTRKSARGGGKGGKSNSSNNNSSRKRGGNSNNNNNNNNPTKKSKPKKDYTKHENRVDFSIRIQVQTRKARGGLPVFTPDGWYKDTELGMKIEMQETHDVEMKHVVDDVTEWFAKNANPEGKIFIPEDKNNVGSAFFCRKGAPEDLQVHFPDDVMESKALVSNTDLKKAIRDWGYEKTIQDTDEERGRSVKGARRYQVTEIVLDLIVTCKLTQPKTKTKSKSTTNPSSTDARDDNSDGSSIINLQPTTQSQKRTRTQDKDVSLELTILGPVKCTDEKKPDTDNTKYKIDSLEPLADTLTIDADNIMAPSAREVKFQMQKHLFENNIPEYMTTVGEGDDEDRAAKRQYDKSPIHFFALLLIHLSFAVGHFSFPCHSWQLFIEFTPFKQALCHF